jgi:hypothetical protein
MTFILNACIFNLFDQILLSAASEGTHAVQHLVEYQSQAPDIAFFTIDV